MKIGIIGAMDVEVAHLKEVMQITNTTTVAKQEYCEGKIGDMDVVVVKCGVGKVRAGMSVQVLCDVFHVTHVLNTGVAGSLNNDINVGDVVVSTDAVEHDMDVSALGDPVGQVPRMDVFAFPADKELVRKAVEANKKANSDIRTFTGRVASGDQFISEKEVKELKNFNYL